MTSESIKPCYFCSKWGLCPDCEDKHKVRLEECQRRLAEEIAEGSAARLADIERKVQRRKELGLSLICTAHELDATPME